VNQLVHGVHVAHVVAVDGMHRQAEFLEHPQGRRRDDVAAMQDGLGAAAMGILGGMLSRRRLSWESETMQIFMADGDK
jgi:hypothetical protein